MAKKNETKSAAKTTSTAKKNDNTVLFSVLRLLAMILAVFAGAFLVKKLKAATAGKDEDLGKRPLKSNYLDATGKVVEFEMPMGEAIFEGLKAEAQRRHNEAVQVFDAAVAASVKKATQGGFSVKAKANGKDGDGIGLTNG